MEGHPEPYTHEEWHEINDIAWEICADCKDHGRIVTTQEWLDMANEEALLYGYPAALNE
jgi:hypothetical protein